MNWNIWTDCVSQTDAWLRVEIRFYRNSISFLSQPVDKITNSFLIFCDKRVKGFGLAFQGWAFFDKYQLSRAQHNTSNQIKHAIN